MAHGGRGMEKILANWGIRFDTPSFQDSVASRSTGRISYMAYCSSDKCCKYSHGSKTLRHAQVLRDSVDRRAKMYDTCQDCGSTLFWSKHSIENDKELEYQQHG